VSYATVKRCLPVFAKDSWRQQLAAACATHAGLGPASLVLYDVSTLYFETDAGDGFREPGFSKERRLDPQITIGLLTDATGFPLMVNAFEGNTAETTTMVPTIQAFMSAHQLSDVTIVADAGMISAANQQAIEAAGLSFILGARIADVPYLVTAWRTEHPDEEIPDGQVFTQPWAGLSGKRRDQVIYYQYRADRARRSLRGIDEQIAKAEKAIAGKTAVKRNRFVQLSGGTRTVNRALEAKARRGRPEGLRHQPRHLPGRHPGHRRVRHRRLPPAIPRSKDRSECPSTTCKPQPGVRGARGCQPLSPLGACIHRQAALEGRIRHRLDPDLGQHTQRLELAGRLDDPRQHQIPEHVIAIGRICQPEIFERPPEGLP